jgi:Winged helix DNA-binding domain
MVEVITARELNRATLARQLLLERAPLSVTDAVRRVVALQAQQPASPYLALWNRVAGFDPAELDGAFASQRVVRAQLMRVTMHAVHAEDHQAFREAMDPTLRASRLTGVHRGHGAVRDGAAGPSQGGGAGARRLAPAMGRSGRHGALRRARCSASRRGHPGGAQANGDVG